MIENQQDLRTDIHDIKYFGYEGLHAMEVYFILIIKGIKLNKNVWNSWYRF